MSLTKELMQLAKLFTSELLSRGEYEEAKAVAIASWSTEREHFPEGVVPVLGKRSRGSWTGLSNVNRWHNV
jgi:hypothetical protein